MLGYGLYTIYTGEKVKDATCGGEMTYISIGITHPHPHETF